MSLDAFANGLLTVLKGTVLPDDQTFDAGKLYNGKISLALSPTMTTNGGRYSGMSATTRFEDYKMLITYSHINGSSLTVDAIRSVLGYHEYFAHGTMGMKHSLLRNMPIDAEIDCIQQSYFTDGRNR